MSACTIPARNALASRSQAPRRSASRRRAACVAVATGRMIVGVACSCLKPHALVQRSPVAPPLARTVLRRRTEHPYSQQALRIGYIQPARYFFRRQSTIKGCAPFTADIASKHIKPPETACDTCSNMGRPYSWRAATPGCEQTKRTCRVAIRADNRRLPRCRAELRQRCVVGPCLSTEPQSESAATAQYTTVPDMSSALVQYRRCAPTPCYSNPSLAKLSEKFRKG